MNKLKRFLDIFLPILVFFSLGFNLIIPFIDRKQWFASADSEWIIDGDTVYINDTKLYADYASDSEAQ